MSRRNLVEAAGRCRARFRFARLAPFDTGTEDGRSNERQRRIALSAVANLAARVLSASVSLLSVPLTIGYLGKERYGLWMTVSSVVAMMSFADLGIGNGLLTKVAEADGKANHEELRRLVSSAFFMLLGVASTLAIATLAVAPFVDWASVLGVTNSLAGAEVRPVMLVLALNCYLAMPLAVVQRVQTGLQAGYAATLWTMAGTALSLVGLVVATSLKSGLVTLVLAISGLPTIVTLANFAWFFGRERVSARPQLSAFDRAHAFTLLRVGALFAILQVAGSIAFLSDNVVIARALGASAVPILAVPAKLFALVTLPVSMIVAPLWPAYGEAKARGDRAWILRTLRGSVVASVLLTAAGATFLVFASPLLVRVWTRGSMSASLALLLPLGIWVCLSAWGQAVAAFLNGTGQIRAQAISAVLMAAAAYWLKCQFVRPLGPGGVVWATVVAYFFITFLPLSWTVRNALRRLGNPLGGTAQP